MHTDLLENLYFEEIRDIRSVKQQILDVLGKIARGASADGMGHALMKLLETTEHHVERLDRIFRELKPAFASDAAPSSSLIARARQPLPPSYARLTSREAEVLQLIAEGFSNKQIAGELAISIKTVEKHRQRMMAKLDLHDTAGVTRYAISAGVVEAAG
jgi:DNA-binding NarL/FixJ family response regulator